MDFNQQLLTYTQWANQALERFLAELPFQNTPLVEAMQYSALSGGKRLRPFLVYATGGMFGIAKEILDVPAAAIECIHAYSLIHDDLPAMDNDDLRRGQPTCHIKFNEAQAILAGDALQTLAFSILSNAPMPGIGANERLAMISELSTASGVSGMCAGQALDLAAVGRQVTLAELEQIHRYKTGALIGAAVRLGALSAGDVGRDCLPHLDHYAQSIGLAFQVQDDILDVIGDTAILGKRQGADQHLGKSTYPALMGLDNAKTKAWNLYQESTKALQQLAAQSLDTTALEALAGYIVQRNK